MKIVIKGVPPWDGAYDLDLDEHGVTNLEWRWIKRFTGYQPLTFGEGFEGGDPDLFTVFALIALHRAGKIAAGDAADLFARFDDVPFGDAIMLEGDETEASDTDPLSPASSDASESSSGPGSRTSSESPDQTQPDSGRPASDISALRLTGSAN